MGEVEVKHGVLKSFSSMTELEDYIRTLVEDQDRLEFLLRRNEELRVYFTTRERVDEYMAKEKIKS